MTNMKCFILILLILNALTSNYTHKDFYNSIKSMPIEKQFNLWADFNNKKYTHNVEEKLLKLEAFKNNLNYITEQNTKNKDYSLGLGPFSDMTFEEFKGLFSDTDESKINIKSQDTEDTEETNELSPLDKGPFTNSVNWEFYFDAKDSKKCFTGGESVVGLMEFLLEKDFNVSAKLSSQNYIDCDYFGCLFSSDALLNFFKNTGAYEEKDYPFTGEKGICLYQRDILSNKCDFTPPYAKLSGFSRTNFDTFEEYYNMLNKKPYIISLFVNRKIQNYTGGILEYIEDLKDKSIPMILVEITNKYFKLLPPFGKRYGENGFIRIGYKYKKDYFRIGAYSQYQVTGVILEKDDD